MKQYTDLAPFYDVLNDGADYDSYFDFISNAFERLSGSTGLKEKRVFDVGCGTGELCLRFADRGWKVTGADISEEMLALADFKASSNNKRIMFTRQDMRSFKTPVAQDLVISCFDCINYLVNPTDIDRFFECVRCSLKPGGVFVFDINSRYKYDTVYADNTFFLEKDEVYCVWENDYSANSGICMFYLNMFAKRTDGSYDHLYEEQKQRYWRPELIEKKLKAHGFEVVNVCEDADVLDFTESSTCKHYYITQKLN